MAERLRVAGSPLLGCSSAGPPQSCEATGSVPHAGACGVQHLPGDPDAGRRRGRLPPLARGPADAPRPRAVAGKDRRAAGDFRAGRRSGCARRLDGGRVSRPGGCPHDGASAGPFGDAWLICRLRGESDASNLAVSGSVPDWARLRVAGAERFAHALGVGWSLARGDRLTHPVRRTALHGAARRHALRHRGAVREHGEGNRRSQRHHRSGSDPCWPGADHSLTAQRWQFRQYPVGKPPAETAVIRDPHRGQGSPPRLWTAR